MKDVLPWARSELDHAAATAGLRALVGRDLIGCDYFFPSFWDSYLPASSPDIDVVDEAVALRLDSGTTVAFRWKMEGRLEGLAFEGECNDEALLAQGRRKLDATRRWLPSQVRQARINGVVAVWGDTEIPGVSGIWAIRLHFDDRVIVIALGEIGADGMPRYQPDSLVVIRERGLAQGYRPPASSTSAWGSD